MGLTKVNPISIFTDMKEEWIEIERNNHTYSHNTVIAISNTGLLKRLNGSIEVIPMRMIIHKNPGIYLSRLIAEHFLPKTDEDIALGRNIVDHITHNPIGMNINDVRNLRWCTQKENCNFEESKHNRANRQLSEESKYNMYYVNKGKHWYNNGVNELFAFECPPGFVKGRL